MPLFWQGAEGSSSLKMDTRSSEAGRGAYDCLLGMTVPRSGGRRECHNKGLKLPAKGADDRGSGRLRRSARAAENYRATGARTCLDPSLSMKQPVYVALVVGLSVERGTR